ncbi:hypothetical protein ACFWAP_21705 [Streptomyces goshikiensis]|uniref:hypothetical protein n=1 Tax=Streptomyces goshikiensis TaxID=1942 RepID=UPI00365D8ABB
MGWDPGKSVRMRHRYQYLTSGVLKDTADKVGGLLWGTEQGAEERVAGAGRSPVPAEPMIHVAGLGERRIAFLHGEHADEVVAWCSEDWPDHVAEVEMWDRWRWEHQGPGDASVLRDQMPECSVVFHGRALFLPGGERVATALPELWSAPAWYFEADVYTDRASAWRTARRPGSGKAAVEAALVEACAQAVDRARNPGRYGDADEW